MPPLHSNPYDTAQPDFAAESHTDAWLALTEAQAIKSLTRLWTLSNEHKKAEQAATDAKECQCQQSQADKEATLTKECKKHKSKFTPVPNTKVPVEPLCIPAHYALKQMESSSYVELYYFTNQGISKAEEVATTPSDGTYVWKTQEDSTHSLVEASSAKRGLKSDPLPDDRLTWKQFFKATPCMIRFMFWLNIQSHPWHTSTDPFTKKALLSYQAKQCHIWHYSIRTPCRFSLAEIEEVLKRT
ncbi:hypothetical protein ID866_11296 [Astraeus odoratus]|nr:hypothetical protein ID866_11296 [Astraeus odoratus]